MKVLALDYGSARTGVAVSDPTGTLARPLGVVHQVRESDGFERLIDVIGIEQPEEIVVGLPLTLRGEHGLQAAETAEFVEALRGGGRDPGGDVRRAVHVEAGRRRRRARGRAPARELSGVAEQPLRSRRAVIRRRRIVAVTLAVLVVGAAGAVAGWGVTRETAAPKAPATTAPPPPPKPFHIVFPEGFTREDMADRVVAVADDRAPQAQRERAPQPHGVPRRERAARSSRASARKPQTNLEGFLFPATYEFLQGHDLAAARRRPDRHVLPQLAEGRHALRALEEPHAVRRADDRVDGREGGQGARGAQADRRRDLQPAAPADGARHRRDAALRAATSRRPSRSRSRSCRARRPTTRATRRACRRRRSRTPASPRSRRPRTRRRSNYLYFARKTDHVHHFFTASSDGVQPVPRRERLRLVTRARRAARASRSRTRSRR